MLAYDVGLYDQRHREPKWSFALSEAPVAEPVSTDDAKLHLRETDTAQDDLISSLITAVRTAQENALGRCLITQTWVLTLDRFPREIKIPRLPIQSVDSITYLDNGGVSQSLNLATDVQIDLTEGRIRPAYGAYWPLARCQLNAVTVTCTMGYGDAGTDVPGPLKTAMMIRLAHIYENREAYTPDVRPYAPNPAVDDLEYDYKVWSF